MYIHICYGIEKESHILELDNGFVRVVDVLDRIRCVKAIKFSVLLLLNEKNEVLSNDQLVYKARYYRLIRRPSRNNRHCLESNI